MKIGGLTAKRRSVDQLEGDFAICRVEFHLAIIPPSDAKLQSSRRELNDAFDATDHIVVTCIFNDNLNEITGAGISIVDIGNTIDFRGLTDMPPLEKYSVSSLTPSTSTVSFLTNQRLLLFE